MSPKLSEGGWEWEGSVLPVNFSFPTDRSQSHGRLTLTITARSAAGAATGQLDHNFDFPERVRRSSVRRAGRHDGRTQPAEQTGVTGHCSLHGHWSVVTGLGSSPETGVCGLGRELLVEFCRSPFSTLTDCKDGGDET